MLLGDLDVRTLTKRASAPGRACHAYHRSFGLRRLVAMGGDDAPRILELSTARPLAVRPVR